MKKISASLLASDNRDVGRVCRRKRRTSATNKTAVGGNNVVNESLKSKKSAIGKSYDKYSTRWKKKRSATLIESDCRNVDSMNHRKRRTSAANKTAVGGINVVNESLKSKKSAIGKSYDKYSTRWTRKRSRERETMQQLLANVDTVRHGTY